MKLLARIALATVVEAQLEFFVPSDNGYSGINEAAVIKSYQKRTIFLSSFLYFRPAAQKKMVK